MANIKTKTVLCALLLSSAAGLIGCGGGEERQAEYLERAKEYYDAENLEKARIEVKNVLQINPENAEARYYLALISEADQDYRAAYGNFNAAVENDPNHTRALNKITEYHLASKDLETAEEKAEAVLAIDAENADALANLSVIYAQQEKRDEALLKAQEALSIDPGHVKAISVLTTLYASDNPELALETISEGIANQSRNESLKVLKLRLLASQGKREEVIALYKELIAEYPDKDFYTVQLVNYYLTDKEGNEESNKDLAEKTLRDLVASKPDAIQPKKWLVEFLFKNRPRDAAKTELINFVNAEGEATELSDMLAQVYINDKDFASAKRLYQPVINKDPTSSQSIDARNKLVAIALLEQDRETIDRLQKEILDLEPENSTALITSAKLKLSEKNIEGAIPDLRVVLKNEPESKEALYLLAESHRQQGSTDLALDNYQRLLNVQPNHFQALVNSAKILVEKNQLDDALALAESAAEVNATNTDVVKLLTDLYSREQRWDDALSAADKLMSSEDTEALSHYLKGRVYLRSKEFDKAISELKSSLELEPSGIETLSSLAGAYSALEQTDKALEYVKGHVAKHPEHTHAKELLASLYASQRDTTRAIELAESIIDENPERISTYVLLGRLYAATKQMDKLEQMYLQGIENNPDSALLRVSLAEVYQATNRIDDAMKQYEETLKVSPQALVAKNNLASLLLDHEDSPEDIQRAVDLSSDLASTNNPAFLDTAGWAQYKLGNYAQAVSLLGAAVENGGKGPVYHYHLGMAYYKSNLATQAKEQLTLALENEAANFVGKDEAEKVLQSL